MSAFFTFQASWYHCTCFVPAHSQWTTTASCAAPCICCNLNSWI